MGKSIQDKRRKALFRAFASSAATVCVVALAIVIPSRPIEFTLGFVCAATFNNALGRWHDYYLLRTRRFFPGSGP